jgi:hypothetical protein
MTPVRRHHLSAEGSSTEEIVVIDTDSDGIRTRTRVLPNQSTEGAQFAAADGAQNAEGARSAEGS